MVMIDDCLLDSVMEQAGKSPRLRMNYNFHKSLDAKAQRLLNALKVGTELPIHRHRHTIETYVLLRGKIDVLFYDDRKVLQNRIHLDPKLGLYGLNIPEGQWHTLEVLEDSVLFEVKDGPYILLQEEDMLR